MQGLPLSKCRCANQVNPIGQLDHVIQAQYLMKQTNCIAVFQAIPIACQCRDLIAVAELGPPDVIDVIDDFSTSAAYDVAILMSQGLAAARLQHMCCQCCSSVQTETTNEWSLNGR